MPRINAKKTKRPRAYTEEEVRAEFLQHVGVLVRYWASLPGKTDLEKCDGVAFSIMAALDGCSASLPGFKVSPHPHHSDKKYHIKNGENWYPTKIDIAGCLHEEMDKYR